MKNIALLLLLPLIISCNNSANFNKKKYTKKLLLTKTKQVNPDKKTSEKKRVKVKKWTKEKRTKTLATPSPKTTPKIDEKTIEKVPLPRKKRRENPYKKARIDRFSESVGATMATSAVTATGTLYMSNISTYLFLWGMIPVPLFSVVFIGILVFLMVYYR